MYKFKTLVGVLFMLLTLTVATAAQGTDSPVVIRLERTPCFGGCPVYSIEIHADGTVTYDGLRFVDVMGEQTSEISTETVDLMLERFEALGFFDWNEKYTEYTVTDLPSAITSVTLDGETHTIERYDGDSSAPIALPYLENWIDIVTWSASWTGKDVSDPYFLENGAPVMTIERQYCYGTCPVYRAALFADGTIVYTGLDYVDHMGVYVWQTRPDRIESLAGWISNFYFDWQDSYEAYYVTDAPTTITSLAWGDNGKRITRYHGDLNAPIGLIDFEDGMDTLINEAMD